MTEATAPAPAPAESASFFEDWIDIFYAPAAVFRRRINENPWKPLLFVTIVLALISFFTFSTMAPIIDAEFMKGMAKANPQPPAEQIEKIRGYVEMSARWGAIVFFPITIAVLAFIMWALGKAFGSQQTFPTAVTVASYSYVPRVVGAVLLGVQGLLMDTSKLTSAAQISIGPARFLDPASNPMLLAVMNRLDLLIIWETLLLSIGIYITGKITKENAVVFGIVMWVLGTLPALRTAYTQM